MIIDSHVHDSHGWFDGIFHCAAYADGAFAFLEQNKAELHDEMKRRGIVFCIEPSIGLGSIEKQLQNARLHAPYIRIALGVHPTRCKLSAWKERKTLRRYLDENEVIAVGETGLDYHKSPDRREIRNQKRWFRYQLRLAHKRALPLVLHIRAADADGLRILGRFRRKLHGGVAHCFCSDYDTAMEYIGLGFALGIGGKLFGNGEEGARLRDAVSRVPLYALLIETDAPFVLPDTATGGPKKRCNSSLILPALVEEIARLRGISVQETEEALYRNTLRVFGLE